MTVDFQGATLQSPAVSGGQQETYEGIGLSINGRKNVTIRNARIRGYRFNTLSDDGIRVLVDGKPVVENWTHHAGANDSGQVSLTGGLHEIEVQYSQEDGAAALSVTWRKATD